MFSLLLKYIEWKYFVQVYFFHFVCVIFSNWEEIKTKTSLNEILRNGGIKMVEEISTTEAWIKNESRKKNVEKKGEKWIAFSIINNYHRFKFFLYCALINVLFERRQFCAGAYHLHNRHNIFDDLGSKNWINFKCCWYFDFQK